ncbi:MAG TPA: hypothetical protein V6D07_02585 [Trichocoleus sp.]
MTYSSLKEMLQKSLNAVILQFFTQLHGSEEDTLKHMDDQHYLSKLGVQTAPQLRRQIYPLEYASPLPLQLSAQCNQSLESCLSQLAENFAQVCAFSESTQYALSLPASTHSILRGVKPTVSTGGHLGLQLSESALLHWLKLLNQAEAWPPAELLALPNSQFKVKQCSTSSSLGLSPLGFIQHIHARSVGLLQVAHPSALKSSGDPTTTGLAFAAPEADVMMLESLDFETHKVIWALTHLVDGLYELSSHHTLGQRGYALSEAVYLWLKGINLNSLAAVYPNLVLQAVRQSLKHLLESRLGCPAVESL